MPPHCPRRRHHDNRNTSPAKTHKPAATSARTSQAAGAFLTADHDGLEFGELASIVKQRQGPSTSLEIDIEIEIEIEVGAVGADATAAEAQAELRRLLRFGPGT